MDRKNSDWALQRIKMVSDASRTGLLRDSRLNWNLSQAIRNPNQSMEWERVATALQVKRLFNANPFPSPDSSVLGSIGIAVADNGQVIGIEPHECHVLVAGQTGSGKSTLIRSLFSQALTVGNPIWLFVKDQSHRSLFEISRDILVVNFRNGVRINPLNPCGVPPEEFSNTFLDFYCQSIWAMSGTRNYLAEFLQALYRDTRTPSMHDLLDAVKSQRHSAFSRTERYRESALNRLGGLLSGSLGRVFDCSRGHEEALLTTNVLFELDGLTQEQQVFVVNLLITNLFWHRLRNPQTAWKFVGCDDANVLFDASFEKRPDLGLPILHHLMTTVRKSRINVFCCTQTPSQVGASIHSNSSVKVMLSLTDARDTDLMAKSFGNLTKEQIALCYQLAPRQVVVKNTLRFQNPALGTIPEIPEACRIDDWVVEGNNTRILARLPEVVPRVSKVETSRSPNQGRRTQARPEKPKAHSNEQVDDDVKAYVMSAWTHQYKATSTQVAKLADLPLGTGSRIAQACAEQGFIRFVQLPFGKGNPKYPIVLDKGLKLLGVKERVSLGRGASHEHTLCQQLIAKHFAEFRAEVEMNRSGKFIDLGIAAQGLVCIEVAMTAANEKNNIERDINIAGANHVVVACIDEKVLAKAREIISSLDAELSRKTRAVLISGLLRSNPGAFLSNLAQEEIP